MLNWLDVVLAIYLVEGLFAFLQFDRRVDSPERGLNCSSANGSSLLSLLDSSGEQCCCSCDGLEVLVVQLGMHSERLDVIIPFLPYFLLIVSSCLHSSIDNPCVSSSCITFVTALSSMRKPV